MARSPRPCRCKRLELRSRRDRRARPRASRSMPLEPRRFRRGCDPWRAWRPAAADACPNAQACTSCETAVITPPSIWTSVRTVLPHVGERSCAQPSTRSSFTPSGSEPASRRISMVYSGAFMTAAMSCLPARLQARCPRPGARRECGRQSAKSRRALASARSAIRASTSTRRRIPAEPRPCHIITRAAADQRRLHLSS